MRYKVNTILDLFVPLNLVLASCKSERGSGRKERTKPPMILDVESAHRTWTILPEAHSVDSSTSWCHGSASGRRGHQPPRLSIPGGDGSPRPHSPPKVVHSQRKNMERPSSSSSSSETQQISVRHIFDAGNNTWESRYSIVSTSGTHVKIPPEATADGVSMKSVTLVDLDIHPGVQEQQKEMEKKKRQRVCKLYMLDFGSGRTSFDSREHVFDVVRVTGLVSMCLDSFVSAIPLGFSLRFVHVRAYEMCSWKGKPVVRVEDIVTDELARESLSMHPKSSDSRHVAESHRIALFQHYVYQLSGHGMVVTECESVIRSGHLWEKESVWSKPCVSSQDSSLGGWEDRGMEGIAAWEEDFTELYSPILGIQPSTALLEMATLDLARRMHSLSLFGNLGGEVESHPLDGAGGLSLSVAADGAAAGAGQGDMQKQQQGESLALRPRNSQREFAAGQGAESPLQRSRETARRAGLQGVDAAGLGQVDVSLAREGRGVGVGRSEDEMRGAGDVELPEGHVKWRRGVHDFTAKQGGNASDNVSLEWLNQAGYGLGRGEGDALGGAVSFEEVLGYSA